ncbi:MAG: hypothetical protein Q4G36_06150 [Paracoccus sp. (in: a-proteobacteria)]|nr:hypothetical protein [Paracoccus sp. (in: a-proteobacteria)]
MSQNSIHDPGDTLPGDYHETRLDVAAALSLLREVWPSNYGKTGCIDFTPDLLGWLYGGPDAPRHILRAIRHDDGRVVGCSALLYRALSIGSRRVAGYISTHLTVRPELEDGTRRQIVRVLTRPLPLLSDENAVILAWHETGKRVIEAARRGAARYGVSLATRSLRQAVINPRRLSMAESAGGETTIRPATRQDMAEILRLADRRAGAIVWRPSADMLFHHLSAAPSAFFRVAERDGAIVGSIGCYNLGWQRGDAVTAMTICEYLDAADPPTANALMREAMSVAKASGTRGIVIENSDSVAPEIAKGCGILPAPRGMELMIRSAGALSLGGAAVMCDVK